MVVFLNKTWHSAELFQFYRNPWYIALHGLWVHDVVFRQYCGCIITELHVVAIRTTPSTIGYRQGF